MKIVGLTGGIGSGKSVVASIFSVMGIPVFNADAAGRKVLEENREVQAAVKKLFGNDAYKQNRPDRAYIASIVFTNDEKLNALNNIIHPAVGLAFKTWVGDVEGSAPYCIREAAILFESGTDKDCHSVISVDASEEIRFERVMARDGVSREAVEARMAKQMLQSEKNDRANLVIANDGAQALIPQVIKFHQKMLQA